ncbi:MAG: hypothetical protein K0U40_09995 [Betaproteobacteria bacterium]|nr:hypothetical protein [Betaproteobacteria bacterium]
MAEPAYFSLEHTPQRCYAVNNRAHFAFSDARKLITQTVLDKSFVTVFPRPVNPAHNSFISALLRMVA